MQPETRLIAPTSRVDRAPWLVELADGTRLVVVATVRDLDRFTRWQEVADV